MIKAFALICVLVLLLVVMGGSSTGQTEPYNQPPPGLSIQVITDPAHKLITVAVQGNDRDLWQWANEQSCADYYPSKSNPDCGCPRGHINKATTFSYSGYISFWTHKPGDDFVDKPDTGQPVLHRVAWSTDGCLPAGWQVVVYSPDE